MDKKEYDRLYYIKNRERKSQLAKLWYIANKDRIRKKQSEYYYANKGDKKPTEFKIEHNKVVTFN
jgi:hypothetical protein